MPRAGPVLSGARTIAPRLRRGILCQRGGAGGLPARRRGAGDDRELRQPGAPRVVARGGAAAGIGRRPAALCHRHGALFLDRPAASRRGNRPGGVSFERGGFPRAAHGGVRHDAHGQIQHDQAARLGGEAYEQRLQTEDRPAHLRLERRIRQREPAGQGFHRGGFPRRHDPLPDAARAGLRADPEQFFPPDCGGPQHAARVDRGQQDSAHGGFGGVLEHGF